MQYAERVSFYDIDLTDGFWKKRQDINRNITIHAVKNRFAQTGRLKAFEFVPLEKGGIEPHFFWDSDVAKWMEAVAYIIEKNSDRALEAEVDALIDLIEAHQQPDGYFNLYFTTVQPGQRFTIRDDHELYCAGHLIEAAVAYYHATGKKKFLDIMLRYVDCIEKAFVIDKTAKFDTPGHEEIELALFKLYKLIKEKRHLELALHFIDRRGMSDADVGAARYGNLAYDQSHLPVREQETAEGHSVRACYLYSAMADLAVETSDMDLYRACLKIFENIYRKRAYITGGIGSSKHGEAFTVDYDLPNTGAYAETCAAIALAYFAGRMQCFEPRAEYADMIERIIYNGMLSGVSLDGKSFFYVNPLEIIRAERNRNRSIKTEPDNIGEITRQEIFDCSCCPPNITRFIASVADFQYTYRDGAIYAHQYMSGNAEFSVNGRSVSVTQKTEYPNNGKVIFNLKNMQGMKFYLRIPMWCKNYSISVQGGTAAPIPTDGYLPICVDENTAMITLGLKMIPEVVFSRPEVAADAGLVAVRRGPLIYCMESCDNGDNLKSIVLNVPLQASAVYNKELDCIMLEADALRILPPDNEKNLYFNRVELVPCKAKFIPYYAFANREESDMIVWCRCNYT